MFNRDLASAKVDCPEGQGYDVPISLIFRRVFPVRERGGFLFIHRPLPFATGDKVQDGLQMEKPRPFHLAGFTDGHAAEMPLARAFVKFGTAETTVKFHALLWGAYPDGQAVGLVLK